VFLALRAKPILGYASDYGEFIETSDDLVHSIDGDVNSDGPPCANQVYSGKNTSSGKWMNFKGDSYATWKAGPQTYGDVELTLLWGNGPGPDDPLSHLFPNLTHAYLYRRVITLKGPKMPDTPPFESRRLGAAQKCVATGKSHYNLPHAPVFVQNLRTFPEKSVTFPSNRCIACREDQKKRCSSAIVDCPVTPGKLAIERLYKTLDCSGEPVSVTKLSTKYVQCPGPEYHSPYKLDLERFVKKVLRDHPTYFKTEESARAALAEYRKMLYLIQKFPDAPVVPSKLVDIVWHEHILDTQTYKQDSQRLFGRYIHHAPAFGDNEDESVKAEKESMLADQHEMFKKYVTLFEDEPPTDVWPTARRLGGAGHLPDCCKAECVKPDCASCVGCNAINCGKLEEKLMSPPGPKQHILPEQFAGYVPIPRSIADNLLSKDQDYLCGVNPFEGMFLKWTIAGDNIYFQQLLDTVKGETWHAVGFADTDPYNMGMSDFTVTLFNQNYSGVRDMYKYDKGNGYPCWDVLTQCSADGQTAGSQDNQDRTNVRQDGWSQSTWSRPLLTGDPKDSDITPVGKQTHFAFGKDDYFTYHSKQQALTCSVNFHTGETDCGAQVNENYVCSVCQHVYDPVADGAGAPFEQLPESWLCPVCGQPKSVYGPQNSPSPQPKPDDASYVCSVCAHVYNATADGDGVAFGDLPDSWLCPVCGQPKSVYGPQVSLI